MSKISLPVTVREASAIMHREEISPVPIGLKTELLSRAMRMHASSGEMHLGSTSVVQRHLTVRAKDRQSKPIASGVRGLADPT